MASYDDRTFERTIAARMSGRVVRKERLVSLDFASRRLNVWMGTGVIRTADGTEYYGAGTLGSIGDIESQSGTSAIQIEIGLSGIDPSVIYAATNEAEYYEREALFYLQHFDEEWKPLDLPWTTASGTMYSMNIDTDRGPDSDKRKITLIIESPWNKRGFAAYGYMGDREQKRFSPDDRGLEFLATMQSKTVTWPVQTND